MISLSMDRHCFFLKGLDSEQFKLYRDTYSVRYMFLMLQQTQ